jgi:hypothetical protein
MAQHETGRHRGHTLDGATRLAVARYSAARQAGRSAAEAETAALQDAAAPPAAELRHALRSLGLIPDAGAPRGHGRSDR